jgi:hypothetical protein
VAKTGQLKIPSLTGKIKTEEEGAMKKLFVFLTIMLLLLLAQPLSIMGETSWNHPRISNPNFSIRENIVKVSFDYLDVAGSIKDARIYLVVSVPINSRMDRLQDFHFVLGGWKGFFWSAEDDQKLTRGRITAKVSLPWYIGINQETNINGFGLAVADARKYISNPYFIQGEIIRETWLARISRFIKKALTKELERIGIWGPVLKKNTPLRSPLDRMLSGGDFFYPLETRAQEGLIYRLIWRKIETYEK